MKRVLAICSLTIFSVCVSAATYSIADFGADTTRICTKSINEAISRAYGDGGGTVVVPAGRYESGTIVLKDNVNLQLDAGAVIEASDDYADFPIMPHSEYRSLKDAGGWSALIMPRRQAISASQAKAQSTGKGADVKGE